MEQMKKEADIFDNEAIIGPSTILIVGTIRIVASKDADHEYHFLLMPIQHRETFAELTANELQDLQLAERCVAEFYRLHGIEGYSKIELVGTGAGRTVPHYHVHILPGKSDNFHNNPADRPLHRNAEDMNALKKRLEPEFKEILEKMPK